MKKYDVGGIDIIDLKNWSKLKLFGPLAMFSMVRLLTFTNPAEVFRTIILALNCL